MLKSPVPLKSLGHRVLLFAALSSSVLFGQEKKDEKKVAAAVQAFPLAVSTGQMVLVTVRGAHLAEASAVKLVSGDKSFDAMLKSKGAVDVPNGYDAKDVGNTRVECELLLPAEFPVGPATLVIATPAGEAKQSLLVFRPEELVVEKEPNDGFKQGQPLPLERTVAGAIQQPKDVDVFEVTAAAGQKLEIAVTASRLGSALDPMVTVFGSQGQIIAQQDDNGADRDPRVVFTAATAGKFLVVIQDAHDRGGLHPYALTVRAAK